MPRVAVVASHPIQYQAPWFRALAVECDLTVLFCHQQDAAGQAAAGFGQAFDWDVPLLDGYHFEWLKNVSRAPSVDRFSGCDTPEIRERLAAGNFDACIVSGWYLKSYLQAIRACWSLQLPVLLRGDSHRKQAAAGVKAAAKYFPYRWMLTRVDAHLVVGRANADYLRHYGVREDRLFFAPHFVDNDRFRSTAARAREDGTVAALRTSFGAGPDTTVFLFAGKLVANKRVPDFVRALAISQQMGQAVRGVVVGSGPEEAAIRALAGQLGVDVTFGGFRNQTEIPAWYAAADALVLPSTRETWGLVVNEAMATGAPAIVSDTVGCGDDLILDGRTGFAYPVTSVEGLAARLAELHGLLRTDAGAVRAAVAAMISKYSVSAAVAGTMAALSSVRRRPAIVARERPQQDHA